MQGAVDSSPPTPAAEQIGDSLQRSISPLSSTSSVSDGRDQHHQEREDDKQQQIETDLLQHHKSTVPTKESSTRTVTTADRWTHFTTDRWIWEICAMLVSLLSMLAIVLVLRLHEGRPLPTWPFSITINSLVSVFATIMKATMLVPIAAGISQAKWHWFRQLHPLNDIEVYDQASRGPWGALKLLWNIRWR